MGIRMPIVTKRFFGVEDGKVFPRHFEPGDEVTGDLGAQAEAGGYCAAPAAANADGVETDDADKARSSPKRQANSKAPEVK